MIRRYRIFLRGNTYYVYDAETGKQTSLRTGEKRKAERLLLAKNDADEQPLMNLAMARTYLAAHDPKLVARTWTEVMDRFSDHGRESTQDRCRRAFASTPFDGIRGKALVETTAENLLDVLKLGGTSMNNYLRGLHNLALNLGWLAWPILAKKAWPPIQHKKHRAVTVEEHERIISMESCLERKLYYELLWITGGSQSDIANLSRDDIDQINGVLYFQRKKLKEDHEPARISIDTSLQAVLEQLPSSGYFFPSVRETPARHRSSEFWRRRQILKIKGISLHSYRYAWAERAKAAAYPERFAMINLGHNSKAVHRAYSKKAQVICPPLDAYEAHETRKCSSDYLPFKSLSDSDLNLE